MKIYHEERMDHIRRAFEADVLLLPDVSPRKMMGCPCYMAGGRMFATIVDDAIVLTRLGETDREELEIELGAGPFTHGSKVMRKWSKVPVGSEEDLRAILPYVMKSYESAVEGQASGT